ncbi:tetratricopeptide repeat protein [Hydrogenimonas sp.]
MSVDHYEAGMNAYDQGCYEEAWRWFMQSPDDPRCQYALGVLHSNGQGVSRDFREAARWYEMAAEAGIVPAQNAIGFAYANALGVPEDFDRAARYLKMACDAGELAACVTLGEIYALGHAGGNREMAADLIKAAIDAGAGEEAHEIWTRYELWKT